MIRSHPQPVTQLAAGPQSPVKSKMDVIIADSDCDYAAALAEGLARYRQNLEIHQCHHPEQLRHWIDAAKGKQQSTIFLYNASEFVELTYLAPASVWPPCWKAVPILASPPDCLPPDPPPSEPAFYRYGSVNTLVRSLFDSDAPPGPEPAQAAEENVRLQPARLWLTVSLQPDLSGQGCLRRLRLLLREGRQVVYLPLMPTYLMAAVNKPASGLSLSDCLMQLAGHAVDANEIGQYWQPHPDGYLCFRPPERADDLVSCEADYLRQLVLVLKQRTESDPTGQMTALIHCAGIPLASIGAVAVLCDVCEIDLPGGSSFAALAAREEAARLMALLPPGCRAVHHVGPEATRLPAADHEKGGRQDAS
ncbi:MAG: hypothetical protein GX112_02325 [Clostridiaceae bacterium]|nr:hypothetical protein [Clostridiaceae bacterium]